MCDQTSVVSICDDMNVDLIIIKLYTDPSDHHHRCLLHLLLGCPPQCISHVPTASSLGWWPYEITRAVDLLIYYLHEVILLASIYTH